MSRASEEFASSLASQFSEIERLSSGQLERLYEHWGLLTRWNKTLNLTTVTDARITVTRHYCESLFLGAHLPRQPLSILDVGSGAGFPGIPAAILRPDCQFTLAESHQRKAVFLREATRDLRNVSVLAKRAESLDLGSFDWVVSRAVRWEVVIKLARRSLGLLAGAEDVAALFGVPGFDWFPALALPWGDRRMLLKGTRTDSAVGK